MAMFGAVNPQHPPGDFNIDVVQTDKSVSGIYLKTEMMGKNSKWFVHPVAEPKLFVADMKLQEAMVVFDRLSGAVDQKLKPSTLFSGLITETLIVDTANEPLRSWLLQVAATKNDGDALIKVSKALLAIVEAPIAELKKDSKQDTAHFAYLKQQAAMAFAELHAKYFFCDKYIAALPAYVAKCYAVAACLHTAESDSKALGVFAKTRLQKIKNNTIHHQPYIVEEEYRSLRFHHTLIDYKTDDVRNRAPCSLAAKDYIIDKKSKTRQPQPQVSTQQKEIFADVSFDGDVSIVARFAFRLVAVTEVGDEKLSYFSAENLKNDLLATLLDQSYMCKLENADAIQRFFDLLKKEKYPSSEKKWADVLAEELPAAIAKKATGLAEIEDKESENKKKWISLLPNPWAKKLLSRSNKPAKKTALEHFALLLAPKKAVDAKVDSKNTEALSLANRVIEAINATAGGEGILAGKSSRAQDLFLVALRAAEGLSTKSTVSITAKQLRDKYNELTPQSAAAAASAGTPKLHA